MHNGDCIAIKDIKPGLKNINVVFIVLDIGTSTVTKENREVRNFKVGDPSACINVSIWDEPGKYVKPGDIIKMTKAYASIWRNCLTLYSGKNGEVSKVGEFCMVFNENLNMSEPRSNQASPTGSTSSLTAVEQTAAAGSNSGSASSSPTISGAATSTGAVAAAATKASGNPRTARGSSARNSNPAAV